MKKIITAIATGLLLSLSLAAVAGSCPMDMRQIDAALAANPALSASELERVMDLRAEGEKLHKAGDHSASVARLDEARKLLGL